MEVFKRTHSWGIGIALVLLGVAQARAQFSTANLPDELTKNANVVIQNYDVHFTLLKPGKAIREETLVVTILNQHGDDWATLAVPYDNFSKVNSISGTLYDKFGGVVRKVKNRDVLDMAMSGNSVLTDNRLKIAELEYNQYPYTVSFTYQLTEENLMFFPKWVPLGGERVSLVAGKFRVTTPADYELRYRTYNLNDPTINSNGDRVEYTWTARNLTPIEAEPMYAEATEIFPMVNLAPSQFVVDGYSGDMQTWALFGQFIQSLNQGRNDLSEERKAEIRQIAANHEDREAKVRALYEYLQGNTRYVSIQLGIGGWQPFYTSFVDEQGYGDCKALSYYMHALLETVNIPSYYALIRAGDDGLLQKLDPSFPESVFNHAVLAVPNGNDTIWLECTSQTAPFNEPSTFTGNREALLITPEGGKIVTTRWYTEHENQSYTVAAVKIDADGNAQIRFSTVSSGMIYSNSSVGVVASMDRKTQVQWLRGMTSLSNFEAGNISFEEGYIGNTIAGTVTADLEARRAASVSGKRMFINPNMFSQSKISLSPLEERKSRMKLSYAYTFMDTVHIEVPEGYYPEMLPEPISIASDFGSYEAQFLFNDQGLMYIRKRTQVDGVYEAERYNDYVSFRKEIERADRTKVVLVNKT